MTTSRRTRAMVLTVEKQLDVLFPVYQGGWNAGGVAVSGGTHDLDAIDLGPTSDPVKAVRALRRVGFAAWYRTPPAFGYHIHAVPLMVPSAAYLYLSAEAKMQCDDYLAGGDGLWPLTGGDDPMPYRPTGSPVIFNYRAWERARLLRGRISTLTERINDLQAKRAAARHRLEKLS